MRLRIGVRDGSATRPKVVSLLLLLGYLAIGHSAIASESLILDTQRGIRDGKAGVLLQTAPLSSAPIVEPAQPRVPAGRTSQTTIPIYVAPYINFPGWSMPMPAQTPPQPLPRQQP